MDILKKTLANCYKPVEYVVAREPNIFKKFVLRELKTLLTGSRIVGKLCQLMKEMVKERSTFKSTQ